MAAVTGKALNGIGASELAQVPRLAFSLKSLIGLVPRIPTELYQRLLRQSLEEVPPQIVPDQETIEVCTAQGFQASDLNRQILELNCPFSWRTESFVTNEAIDLGSAESDLTISFTATRQSKILGYIPMVGTAIGVHRIYQGFLEYRVFEQAHLHHLSRRSINWIIRGSIELFPIIGGIICMIADMIATYLLPSPGPLMLPDATPCGRCPKPSCEFISV